MGFFHKLWGGIKAVADPVGAISKALTGHNLGWTGAVDAATGGGLFGGGGGGTRQAARTQLDQAATAADPFAHYRGAMAQQLANLFTPGKSTQTLANLPGYKFSLQQGDQAIQRHLGAVGAGVSSNLLRNMDKYSQGLAQQTFNHQAGLLTNLAGATAQNAIAAGGISSGKSKITLGGLQAHNALLGDVIGAGGTIVGGMLGGPIGAGIGGSLGSMFGGGGSYPQLQGTTLGLGSGGIGSLNTSL